MTATQKFWTTGDVARAEGVSHQCVREWERRGLLTSMRTVGGIRLYRPDDVRRLLEQRRKQRQEAATA